ncbi:hydroxymethylbilane synthase [Desulfuribacillus stibiiarsenatis]|uniref:Porphobilinogen deaminase n=1 Tax=Desulfuribacillus stibiiarsenatis TaxID=1390249 RepID=A0A1E5L220_9FIRM|nr:hydroxymethylbilane synthase [Desulfuribacillus stibiiarsenatis]OEH84198.1 hydroxymethylbilane synthase [Desulfuribacillus stibiiarsenatis]
MRKIIIGTRKSELALTQTNWVISQLEKLNLPYEFEVKKIMTKGDQILDVTLSKVGGKGLFVKEIEQALIDKEIDIAVHSMKDMPAEMPEGLVIGATTIREDVRDALIAKEANMTIANLPQGANIGTSSLRRSAQLLNLRPDLKITSIRGNVGTRIGKIQELDLDGVILACAGLNRLGQSDHITEAIDPTQCVPAVGQGALGIQCRDNDEDVLALLQHLNHLPTEKAVMAERSFLKQLEGGCQVPIGAYGEWDGSQVTLTGMVAKVDGSKVVKHTRTGADPVALGLEVAQLLAREGAEEILKEAKEICNG